MVSIVQLLVWIWVVIAPNFKPLSIVPHTISMMITDEIISLMWSYHWCDHFTDVVTSFLYKLSFSVKLLSVVNCSLESQLMMWAYQMCFLSEVHFTNEYYLIDWLKRMIWQCWYDQSSASDSSSGVNCLYHLQYNVISFIPCFHWYCG